MAKFLGTLLLGTLGIAGMSFLTFHATKDAWNEAQNQEDEEEELGI